MVTLATPAAMRAAQSALAEAPSMIVLWEVSHLPFLTALFGEQLQ